MNEAITKLKENPTDPLAILINGMFVCLAALRVPSRTGLTAEEVLAFLGGVYMIAGAIRFWAISRAKAKAKS